MLFINAAGISAVCTFFTSKISLLSCDMQPNYNIQPSYFGFVETRGDAVILIQACLDKSLDSVPGRPTPSERHSIAQSGHVFVYEEKASGIQR